MSETVKEGRFFPLSAVNHYSFCPRRCALVHSECIWSENYFTTSGKELHVKVDAGGSESRKDRRFVRSFRLFSRELGVSGIADVVEFRQDDEAGASILGWPGRWMPYPVEYKWGTAKNEVPYKRQLCAQAICLEELFHVRIHEGALYVGVEKHRRPVILDEPLRSDTKSVCIAIRRMLESGETPSAQFAPYCKSCSLVDDCMPKLSHRSAKCWLEQELKAIDYSLDGRADKRAKLK